MLRKESHRHAVSQSSAAGSRRYNKNRRSPRAPPARKIRFQTFPLLAGASAPEKCQDDDGQRQSEQHGRKSVADFRGTLFEVRNHFSASGSRMELGLAPDRLG